MPFDLSNKTSEKESIPMQQPDPDQDLTCN